MLQAFTKKCIDESTPEEFSFTFHCDLCGKTWKGVPIPFSEGKKRNSIFSLLGLKSAKWQSEHKDAFERANREGMFHFNRCQVCKSWVCDEDFLEDENICNLCQKKQHEKL